MALDCLLDLLAHWFLCFSCISLFYLFLCAADKVGQLSGQILGAQ